MIQSGKLAAMPSKKKSKPKKSKSRNATSSKTKKKSAATKRTAVAKTAKKKKASKKTAVRASGSRPKARDSRKKKASVSAEREIEQQIRGRGRAGLISRTQPPDFQGLSRSEEADSESVDELVEEGNIFEAGAVAGVEEADNADEREVHTHEVPEDDVPEEYDQD